MEHAGYNVDFRDYQLDPEADAFNPDRLVDYLGDHASILAISCFVDMLPVVIEASRRIHAAAPKTEILLGGPGPTASALEIVKTYPWIAGVVRGEGEETVVDWLKRGTCAESPIRGMVARNGPNVMDGGERPRIRDLDALPGPAYHLIDWSSYTHARIITTRGCSYRCSFCDVTALWKNLSVYRNLEQVLDEINLLQHTYNKDMIAIVDDTFVLNRKRVAALCELILDRGIEIQWGCFGRINLMRNGLIELMAEAGCKAVFYGIDSGSQEILDKTHKVIRKETILNCLRESSEYFEKVEASFIWGYPFETLEQFQETLELAGEASKFAPRVNVQLHMLSPLPLSPIYVQYEGDIVPPELEDKDWLLLPSILLDDRAGAIRSLVESRPDIFPGFFTFPTPDKEAKRTMLKECMQSLDRTIGQTMFNERISNLLEFEDRDTESALLESAQGPAERVGIGLALGLFRRTRRRAGAMGGDSFNEGNRGASIVRQRNDSF
jgi:radical SAM superfamily enzyme YgiQ (UPF0313 family)